MAFEQFKRKDESKAADVNMKMEEVDAEQQDSLKKATENPSLSAFSIPEAANSNESIKKHLDSIDEKAFIKEGKALVQHLREKYSSILAVEFVYWGAGGSRRSDIFMPLKVFKDRENITSEELNAIDEKDEDELYNIKHLISMMSQDHSLTKDLLVNSDGLTPNTKGISFGEYLNRFDKAIDSFEKTTNN